MTLLAHRRWFCPPPFSRCVRSWAFRLQQDRLYGTSSFVATPEGIVSLGNLGKPGGGEISGFNQHDQGLMGFLHAAAKP